MSTEGSGSAPSSRRGSDGQGSFDDIIPPVKKSEFDSGEEDYSPDKPGKKKKKGKAKGAKGANVMGSQMQRASHIRDSAIQ